MNLELSHQIEALKPGGHLCLFYTDDPAEQIPALAVFVRDGLRRNEQFIYVADDQTVEQLANRLEQHDIDVDEERRCHRLRLITRKEWRQPGELDPARKAQQVRQYIAEAARAGFKGIRFAVEMTWTLGPDIQARDLEIWEATINTLFEPSFPGRIICQYNRSRLAPEVLLTALRTHPEAILGSSVYPNPFYEAPLILKNGSQGHDGNGIDVTARVDWMLGQLERVRAAELDRQALVRERAARVEAEAALAQAAASEQRLRAVVEHCPECVKVLRPDGTLAEMNTAGLRMVQADSPEQVLGKSIMGLIAPEDRDRFQAMHERVCRGASARLEFQIVGLRGARLLMETHAAPVPEPGGAGFLHIAVTRDITHRNQAETANRWLSAIVESSDDAIISKDLNGIIMTWNHGAHRMFGYTAEEAIGHPVSMLIPQELQDEEPDILRRIRNGQRIDHYETVRKRKDGTRLDISLSVSPVRDGEGKIVGASKIARDITARKRAEEEIRAGREKLAQLNADLEWRVRERTRSLTEAITQMEEFSYTVSHDLRAPARSMRCYAKIILNEHGQNLHPEARDFLERIVRGGERMDRLIQDVLTYSRLSRRELQLQPVCLHKLVADIVQQYPEMQPPRAEVNLLGPLLDVRAHEPSLAQAISNLLANAVKFIPPGETPRITVRTESRPPRVRLWVEDNGIGIKPEHQSRIFGVFERLPTPTRYEGTGIGLAIVRRAVEKMGGEVGVESDGLTGSRFWLQLPPAQIL